MRKTSVYSGSNLGESQRLSYLRTHQSDSNVDLPYRSECTFQFWETLSLAPSFQSISAGVLGGVDSVQSISVILVTFQILIQHLARVDCCPSSPTAAHNSTINQQLAFVF